jgi:protein phosphatase 1 regulatory subunit 11
MATIQPPTNPHGRQTQTQTQAPTNVVTNSAPVLRLRGAAREAESSANGAGRRIQWAEDVVDNEGMGKKTSKGL